MDRQRQIGFAGHSVQTCFGGHAFLAYVAVRHIFGSRHLGSSVAVLFESVRFEDHALVSIECFGDGAPFLAGNLLLFLVLFEPLDLLDPEQGFLFGNCLGLLDHILIQFGEEVHGGAIERGSGEDFFGFRSAH